MKWFLAIPNYKCWNDFSAVWHVVSVEYTFSRKLVRQSRFVQCNMKNTWPIKHKFQQNIFSKPKKVLEKSEVIDLFFELTILLRRIGFYIHRKKKINIITITTLVMIFWIFYVIRYFLPLDIHDWWSHAYIFVFFFFPPLILFDMHLSN